MVEKKKKKEPNQTPFIPGVTAPVRSEIEQKIRKAKKQTISGGGGGSRTEAPKQTVVKAPIIIEAPKPIKRFGRGTEPKEAPTEIRPITPLERTLIKRRTGQFIDPETGRKVAREEVVLFDPRGKPLGGGAFTGTERLATLEEIKEFDRATKELQASTDAEPGALKKAGGRIGTAAEEKIFRSRKTFKAATTDPVFGALEKRGVTPESIGALAGKGVEKFDLPGIRITDIPGFSKKAGQFTSGAVEAQLVDIRDKPLKQAALVGAGGLVSVGTKAAIKGGTVIGSAIGSARSGAAGAISGARLGALTTKIGVGATGVVFGGAIAAQEATAFAAAPTIKAKGAVVGVAAKDLALFGAGAKAGTLASSKLIKDFKPTVSIKEPKPKSVTKGDTLLTVLRQGDRARQIGQFELTTVKAPRREYVFPRFVGGTLFSEKQLKQVPLPKLKQIFKGEYITKLSEPGAVKTSFTEPFFIKQGKVEQTLRGTKTVQIFSKSGTIDLQGNVKTSKLTISRLQGLTRSVDEGKLIKPERLSPAQRAAFKALTSKNIGDTQITRKLGKGVKFSTGEVLVTDLIDIGKTSGKVKPLGRRIRRGELVALQKSRGETQYAREFGLTSSELIGEQLAVADITFPKRATPRGIKKITGKVRVKEFNLPEPTIKTTGYAVKTRPQVIQKAKVIPELKLLTEQKAAIALQDSRAVQTRAISTKTPSVRTSQTTRAVVGTTTKENQIARVETRQLSPTVSRELSKSVSKVIPRTLPRSIIKGAAKATSKEITKQQFKLTQKPLQKQVTKSITRRVSKISPAFSLRTLYRPPRTPPVIPFAFFEQRSRRKKSRRKGFREGAFVSPSLTARVTGKTQVIKTKNLGKIASKRYTGLETRGVPIIK